MENEINRWSGFGYDRYNKEVETEIFIHSINEKKLC